MEPTYAHTCVKGIKLAAGELSDSTEEEEVEAMEMYARLAEAEDPRDFEQTLQEARKRAEVEDNEMRETIETLEELAREHVNDSLTVMEYRYELRQMTRFGFLSGLISAPRAHVERNVAKAVLQGSPKNLRTALMVLSTFPPVRYAVSPLRHRRVIIRSRTPSTSSLHRASRFVDGERNTRRSRTRSRSSLPRRRRSTTSRAPWRPSSPTTRPSGLDSALIPSTRDAIDATPDAGSRKNWARFARRRTRASPSS